MGGVTSGPGNSPAFRRLGRERAGEVDVGTVRSADEDGDDQFVG